MNRPRFVILGPQGAGKGTQAGRLVHRFHITHIYPGQIIRDEMTAGTALGKKVAKTMNAGKLIPNRITNRLIRERIESKICQSGWITDGYPRNLAQAKPFQKFGHPNLIIHLHLTDDAAVKRLSGRRMCSRGHVYHLQHDPPKKRRGYCDHDGLKLFQREDDTPQAIRKRLHIYHHETEPLLHWYKEKVLIITVDAHKSIPLVYRDMIAKMKRISWLSSRLDQK